ncbi:MAG: ATP-dependent DNA helicase RecQ, partial [uncultured Solirubrobacteraceae bacterium]
ARVSRDDPPCREGGVRLRRAAPGPARGDPVRAGRPRHAGRDVDRLGQVRDLPDRRAADRGLDRRGQPAHRAAARPGRGPQRARGGRRRPAQLERLEVQARGGARRARRGRARVPLPGARAARQRRRARRARDRPPLPARRRRGARHLGVGPRLPAGVPADRRRGGGARPPDDHRADRHRRAARARGDRRAARPPGPVDHRPWVRPPQHLPRGGALLRRPPPAQGAHRARRGLPAARDRLLGDAQVGRGPRGRARRARRARGGLPRRPAPQAARRGAGALHDRPARLRGGDHRVRDGRRQGQRPLGVPLGPRRLGGLLLPGARACRPRWRAGRVGPLLPPRGSRGAALLRGRRPGRGGGAREGRLHGRARRRARRADRSPGGGPALGVQADHGDLAPRGRGRGGGPAQRRDRGGRGGARARGGGRRGAAHRGAAPDVRPLARGDDAGLRGDERVPPRVHPRLLRRALRAAVRQLRQLPLRPLHGAAGRRPVRGRGARAPRVVGRGRRAALRRLVGLRALRRRGVQDARDRRGGRARVARAGL